MITPGEAKQGYKFICNIVDDESEDIKLYLSDFYNKNKKVVDYKRLKYVIGSVMRSETLSDDFIMNSFTSYILKDEQQKENKYTYVNKLNCILSYICSDKSIISNELKKYQKYGDNIKKVEKNKKENYISEKLDNLIGMDNVKKEIKQLSDLAYITKLRNEKGMKVNPITMHMVFTGNPGTGKTTVARIIADLYYNLGIIKENKLIEVSREDLVAEYLGQSEAKTKKVLEKSKGGVLFIDEAYSLTQNNDVYGTEVVNTILKFMEDNRDDTVIIIAGYQKEIKQFIKSNPGLKSRFNTYLEFENYNSDELFQILQKMVSNNEYTILESDLKKVLNRIKKIDTNASDFSNARYVRNLFELAIKNQAARIANKDNINDSDLTTLIYEDFFD